MAKREGGELLFSVEEAAYVIGVTRQTLYAAVAKGKVPYIGEDYGIKIRVQDVILRAVQTGKETKEVLNRVYGRARLTDYPDGFSPDMLWRDIAYWLLEALGVAWLMTRMLRPDEFRPGLDEQLQWGLDKRILYRLRSKGIDTLGDLIECPPEELLAIHGFEVSDLPEIEKWLAQSGYALPDHREVTRDGYLDTAHEATLRKRKNESKARALGN